ncbi:T9SS type A sorting domain-containing protein [Flavobacterium silvisoli]|uniref:T9SS type A sorting domain-containing protein n=1 Tax=Flavobacterium silvisoli TaxID=2529433 RepID=A0A4Q9YR41_9FLAO|nr:T9SS type A sorting domain-containing protein [Flavobacterium silvisoli]TBX65964.1 T9SS type A sorting domain-containing protein [Flavobacterium silvisoli]
MKNKLHYFFPALFFLTTILTQAQEFPKLKASPTGVVRCATVENEALLRSKFPDRETTEEFENWMAEKIAESKENTVESTNSIITIPVVVHILSNGDPVGSNENLADVRVFAQIQSLNQDFRRMLNTPGYNDNEVGADIEIEFCLAQRKPDGTATNGIDRVTTSFAAFTSRTDVETMKTTTQWDPTKYFNIWVVNFSGGLGNLLGYAQFPSTSGLSGLNANGGAANTDGVVIKYTSFGSKLITTVGPYDATYNGGRTTTHEIGHCLGLRHIWGDGNGDPQTHSPDCSMSDYCNDTPVAGYEHWGCQSGDDSCFDDAGQIDMVENYMDYSDDSCMNIFTLDQKTRILTVMNNSIRRKELKTSNACSPPLSVTQHNFANSVAIYPNPASSVLNYIVKNDFVISSITIHDISGKEVMYTEVGNNPTQIEVSTLSAGVYFVTFKSDNTTTTKKFIKD